MPNNHSLTAEHRRHDPLLVARFAVGDAAHGQEHEARELVRRCSECAALAADISAISKSVAKLPAPPRQRDFRLTEEQAALLRGGRFDRWLRSIAGSGWSTVRPVAAVALSIGLVMSVVGVLPILGAAAPRPIDSVGAPVAAPAGQPSPESSADARSNQGDKAPSPGGVQIQPPGGAGAPEVASTPAADYLDDAYLLPESPAVEAQPDETSDSQTGLTEPTSGPPALLLVSGLGVSVVALVLLALLYAARRRTYDPLLR